MAALALSQGCSQTRLHVETRLIARQADTTIASRTGLATEVVVAYTTYFYDVRPLLDHSDAFFFATFGPRLHDPDGGGPEAALKLLACWS